MRLYTNLFFFPQNPGRPAFNVYSFSCRLHIFFFCLCWNISFDRLLYRNDFWFIGCDFYFCRTVDMRVTYFYFNIDIGCFERQLLCNTSSHQRKIARHQFSFFRDAITSNTNPFMCSFCWKELKCFVSVQLDWFINFLVLWVCRIWARFPTILFFIIQSLLIWAWNDMLVFTCDHFYICFWLWYTSHLFILQFSTEQ